MTTFYIGRHGETDNNRKRRSQGWIDTPLIEEGIQNAESLAEKVKGVHFDKIVSSDLGRAFITAYIVSRAVGYTGEIERYSGLREINYGDFANKKYEDFPQMSPSDNAGFVFPGGESLEQMKARTLQTLADISSQNLGLTLLIIAHDGSINAIRSQYDGTDMGIADQTRNSHDYVASFVYDDGAITAFNAIKSA